MERTIHRLVVSTPLKNIRTSVRMILPKKILENLLQRMILEYLYLRTSRNRSLEWKKPHPCGPSASFPWDSQVADSGPRVDQCNLATSPCAPHRGIATVPLVVGYPDDCRVVNIYLPFENLAKIFHRFFEKQTSCCKTGC